jgi:hypothetical protein
MISALPHAIVAGEYVRLQNVRARGYRFVTLAGIHAPASG